MYRTRKTTTLGAILLVAALPAFAEGGREVKLEYRREAVQRPASVRPANTVPRELRIELDETAIEKLKAPPKSSGGVVSAKPSYHGDLAARARDAASWSAHEMVEHKGRREAYQMGFYDGIHTALDDPRLGRWDYHDGLERGRHARDARHMGSELGYDAAHEAADRAASETVSDQFHDLSREPRPRPSIPTPPFAAALYEVRPPRLEDVFRSTAWHGEGAFRPDPWSFYRYSGHHDFYDSRWWDAGKALEHWVSRHRSAWRELDDEQKVGFKKVFRHEYRRQVASTYARVAERSYHRGFDHGWDYGARVSYEWHYRRGYHEGWKEALRRSAEAAFDGSFPETYRERYGAYFRDWSTTARPEIRRVELFDKNDDGVFEPGESLWAEYEVVNYGGAPGRFDVHLGGDVLQRAVADRVEVPRRSVWGSRRPLETSIDPAVAPRTQTELFFALAELEQRLPFTVAYPLELDRRVRLVTHDSLAGRAVIETVVRNISRRPVPGQVSLASAATPRALPPSYFPEISAGDERRVTFRLEGLEPLDLLAGAVRLDLEVRSRGRRHDALAYRLPEFALDLAARDLLVFMEDLARRESISDQAVRRAQDLMLRRLRADWEAVATASGNRYKSDLKKGTRLTALGDLVWTFQADRAGLRHPEVFTALTPRIEELAKSAPGAHPFLRRSMKKLARQLES